MSTAGTFTCFGALPPELRLQIWGEALSVRSVWTAIRNHAADGGPTPNQPPFIMTYVGPAPYLAGLSSREARRLLERCYAKLICGPNTWGTNAGAYHWVNLDNTVVYLGDVAEAVAVLDTFAQIDRSNFKHVAIRWDKGFSSLARACQGFSTACPTLRTIIIQRTEDGQLLGEPPLRQLSLGLAAFYATILEYAGPELGCEKLDTNHFRALLLQYFGESPPRLHLVTSDRPAACHGVDSLVEMSSASM